ncbi:hypothetical protein SAMN05421594_0176 [Chryseobacterium oleae]|uniref:Uncharacterized protein n=1 Tax=Chryseobacterium oleae TaxID=491207 RepID=A0A1I4VDF5_CHROL|nr:hypothetical protein [Chryseobacterium oleae]SFM99189.1 hypothetical protein SAMN05421594_0176 [Chryseobacterium oleae]
MKKLLPAFVLFTLIYCKEEPKKENKATVEKETTAPTKAEVIKDAVYTELKPDKISDLKIKGFDIEQAFSVEGNKIVAGNFQFTDGKITLPDTEEDFGKRLLLLNHKNEIIYQSPGSGEAYLYEPYFYKNSQNGNIIIVCQLAYEYFFGGDVYLLEKGKIRYLGNLDIEPNNEERKLTDILLIKESGNGITFSFDSDSLVLKPGSEDITIKNNDVKYVYDYKSLKLYQ